ncbi:MAG: PstS family phosphate ABC transporter substrate-binding protein [Phycisphaerales bacterium]|nr:PstS family phosphate ABC transporter substrate-binding protein [Phycisphaerales bacterium]
MMGLAASLVLGVGVSPASGQGRLIRIDGSSTVYPVTEAVAEEFQDANQGMRVTVGVSGTGGGFKKFCRGEIDIANASRPIMAEEMKAAKANGVEYIELPICFDALTVVVNKTNTWAETITVAELKKMWEPGAQGKVTRWNQINPRWPDAPLTLYGAGSDSGTFDYFTEAVCGKAKASRGDYTASEDDNVLVRGVDGDKNAIGYFGYAYFAEHKDKLKAVKIDDGKGGGAVEPNPESVIKGKYNPLSRPLFIYVNKKAAESRPEVKKFVEYYLENAASLAEEVKYVALPQAAYKMARERWNKLDTGTVFGGKPEVGLTIEQLLTRETVDAVKDAAKPEEKK